MNIVKTSLIMLATSLVLVACGSKNIFQWSSEGPIDDMTCVQWKEGSDPDGWDNNYLCSEEDYGIKWRLAGPIDGMQCINMNDPDQPSEHTWGDNHLCVPADSSLAFQWSTDGEIEGMTCLEITEPNDANWKDNYLCY